MEEASTSQVTPLEPLPDPDQEKRLWIGNLDPRVTEYKLVKLVQRFGPIEKFDLMFHRSGPHEGQPRGYAFVSYKRLEDAVKAREKMNGVTMGNRRIAVKWAHTINPEELDKSRHIPEISALAGAKKPKTPSKVNAIEAIEAKLRLMESAPEPEPDFTGNPRLANQPAVWKPPPPIVAALPRRRTHRDTHHDGRRKVGRWK